MARGRHKIPAELQRKRGNPRKVAAKTIHAAAAFGADGAAVPVGISGPDDAPPDRSLEAPERMAEGAREVWNALLQAPVLQLALKGSDAFVFERYCTRAYEWLVLTAALTDRRVKGGLRLMETYEREGYGVVTKVRPEVGMRSACEAELRAIERDMGLNPVARATLYTRLSEVGDPTRPGVPRPAANRDSVPPGAPDSPIGLLANTHKPN